MSSRDSAIAALVEAAPPLTPDQQALLAGLLSDSKCESSAA